MKASLYCLCLYLHSVIWLHVAHPPDEETKALGGAVTLLPLQQIAAEHLLCARHCPEASQVLCSLRGGGQGLGQSLLGGGGCLVHLPHLPVPSEGPDALFPACTSRDEVKKKSPF